MFQYRMKSNTLTSRSAFIGTRLVTTHRPQNSPTTFDVQPIQMSRVCQLTGKKPNNGFRISFSHKRNKHRQNPNLQKKMIYWPEGQRYVKLKISTKAMRTIEKKGLEEMAKEAGIDLWKLPFRDVRPERLEYLKDHPMEVPMKKRPNAMKNPEKIANSKKKPLIGRYADGRIYYTRDY